MLVGFNFLQKKKSEKKFPVKELSHETGRKHTVTVHGQEVYMQWGTA